MEQVVLVDERDREIGVMEKMEAHQKALLHRAFSVFIFNNKGEMLLQQRAFTKYHSGGLWTNACCSHPKPKETVFTAAQRRLVEEMGFNTSLEKVFDFKYKAAFGNGLTEHEFDHVLVGYFDGNIKANNNEVHHFEYKRMDEIEADLYTENDKYTAWFCIAFPKVYHWWQQQFAVASQLQILNH